MIFSCMIGTFVIVDLCIRSSHPRNNCCWDVSCTGGGILSNKVIGKLSCKTADGYGVGEPSSNYDTSTTSYNEEFLHQKTILCMFAWHVKACGSCLSWGRLSD